MKINDEDIAGHYFRYIAIPKYGKGVYYCNKCLALSSEKVDECDRCGSKAIHRLFLKSNNKRRDKEEIKKG